MLEKEYKLHNSAELSQAEIDAVLDMFKDPERFAILRKILQVFSDEERGILIPSEEALIDVNPEDFAKYGMKVAINARADEKVRQALNAFYQKVKTWKDSQAQEEKDKVEKLKEEKEKEKKVVGDNI